MAVAMRVIVAVVVILRMIVVVRVAVAVVSVVSGRSGIVPWRRGSAGP